MLLEGCTRFPKWFLHKFISRNVKRMHGQASYDRAIIMQHYNHVVMVSSVNMYGCKQNYHAGHVSHCHYALGAAFPLQAFAFLEVYEFVQQLRSGLSFSCNDCVLSWGIEESQISGRNMTHEHVLYCVRNVPNAGAVTTYQELEVRALDPTSRFMCR